MARKLNLTQPALRLPPPPPPPAPVCEVCWRRAPFGYGQPGWEGLRQDRTWFCADHRPEKVMNP